MNQVQMISKWNWLERLLKKSKHVLSEPKIVKRRKAMLHQAALAQLQEVARTGGNVFEELMETVKVASLGQITDALFRVGGQYRRICDENLHRIDIF
jgi:methylmalonyl-CoA mutase